MRIKLLAIFFSLLLGSCALNKQVFISNNCEFPINSPYPGGVLSAEITNRKFNENEEIIKENKELQDKIDESQDKLSMINDELDTKTSVMYISLYL